MASCMYTRLASIPIGLPFINVLLKPPQCSQTTVLCLSSIRCRSKNSAYQISDSLVHKAGPVAAVCTLETASISKHATEVRHDYKTQWQVDCSPALNQGGLWSVELPLAAFTLAFIMYLAGPDPAQALVELHQKAPLDQDMTALALGGPLLEEEFWENVSRYVIYFFTVASGGAYSLLRPLTDMLKSPGTILLLVTIVGGSLFLTYLTVSSMLGIEGYQYGYQSSM